MNHEVDNLPNPFAASRERAGASRERAGASRERAGASRERAGASPQQPVPEVPQQHRKSEPGIDPATAEIVRAIEHELRHPRLIDKYRPFGSAPHLLEEFRKRIENGE